MTQVSVKGTVHAPAERVWETIGAFSGLERFFPAVSHSALEGSGVGAVRRCTLRDGGQLVERLESLDEANRTLTYSIVEGALPVKNYRSTMTVRALDGERCELHWRSEFEVAEGGEDALKGLLAGAYKQGIDGIEQLLAP